jgi:hypothetical protein
MFRKPTSLKAHGTSKSAAAPTWISVTSALVISMLVTSCLDFGEENEFFAPDVTAVHLQVIEKRTGINLPEGTVGLALYSNATGIDPWMLAKVRIPSDKAEALLASEPFKLHKPLNPMTFVGTSRPWWKPYELTKAYSGQFDIKSDLVMWTLGQESADHMLYIKWITF